MYTKSEVLEFLRTVDKDFPIPLSQKTDLSFFVDKLCQKATLVTQYADGKLIGVVAGYIKDTPEQIGYITVCACLQEYRGMGIAKTLLKIFLRQSQEQNLKGVHLYTHATNAGAIKLYRDLGFEIYSEEERVGDIHLAYWFDNEDSRRKL